MIADILIYLSAGTMRADRAAGTQEGESCNSNREHVHQG